MFVTRRAVLRGPGRGRPVLLRAARGRCLARAGWREGRCASGGALAAAPSVLSAGDGGRGVPVPGGAAAQGRRGQGRGAGGRARRGGGGRRGGIGAGGRVGRAGAVTPRGAQGRAAGPDMVMPPAAGRDAGGAAVGPHGDVPRERPIGSRGYVRPVPDGSAEDVQVRGRRAGPEPLGAGPEGRAGARGGRAGFRGGFGRW